MKKFNRIILSITLALAFIANSVTFICAEEQAREYTVSDYINNEVYIAYDDGTDEVISYNSTEELEEGIEKIKAYSNVTLVQPNFCYENTGLNTINDPLAEEQWALKNDGDFYMEEKQNDFPVYDLPFGMPQLPGQWHIPDNFGIPGGFMGFSTNASSGPDVIAVKDVDINADEAWSLYKGSRDVVVALIDTGIDYSHEDISNNIWINKDEIPNNGIDDDNNGYADDVYGWNFYKNNNNVYVGEEDSHGTHGAGTIIAKANNGIGIAGIVQSENVKVMAVKALGGIGGTGTTQSIISAIKYAEANGASICNLSLGTPNNDEALYNTIANSSMLFVVAAGNDGTDIDITPTYPAAYSLDNILTVANVNYDGSLHYSSGYGKASVDVGAPGSYILSSTPNNSYSYMTGTSMAAPMVSGGAAMIYSHFNNISLADVKEIIIKSVKPLDSLKNTTLSGGMLNLSAALKYDATTLSHRKWSTPKAWSQTKTQPKPQTTSPKTGTKPQNGTVVTPPQNNNGNRPQQGNNLPQNNTPQYNDGQQDLTQQFMDQWMNQVINEFFGMFPW